MPPEKEEAIPKGRMNKGRSQHPPVKQGKYRGEVEV
jgi:hypothetical protein